MRADALALALSAGLTFPASAAEPDPRRDATVAATEKVLPTVVNIATETVQEHDDWYDTLLRQFYGLRPRQQKTFSLGSGVIVQEDGYLLTNFHVIQRASRIYVRLWDGKEYEADAIGATQFRDVALLKLRAKPGEKFKAISFAPDDDLLLGETVLALGNPFGLGGAVTRGILSSKNRRPSTGNEPLNVEDWLQTDAAINPGNSGGPLVNLKGQLIGLNVAVYREQDGTRGMGVGFSIPVKQISATLGKFFSPELTDSLWFGAQLRGVTGTPEITDVQPGSPAALAGLRPGDHLLQVNGAPAEGLMGAHHLLLADPAREIKLLVVRSNTPSGKAASPDLSGKRVTAALRLIPFPEMIRRKTGLNLAERPSPAAGTTQGLLIDGVDANSPAAAADLRSGYLLTAIDDQATPDLRTAGHILSAKAKDQAVRLQVVAPRRVGTRYVELRQGVADLRLR